MALDMLRVLVKTPELNSVDRKPRSVPILNPRYTHGRVFLSWLGFLNAFLSWYALETLSTGIPPSSLRSYRLYS